jgi:hypothetical protein
VHHGELAFGEAGMQKCNVECCPLHKFLAKDNYYFYKSTI